MITVISGTNRPQSNTLKVTNNYISLMQKQGVSPKMLTLEMLPKDIAFNDLLGIRSTQFTEIINQFILPAEKFVILSPEYNGSFPGILKVFLDTLPPATLKGKKVALIGVSSGRAGNLRGMDHLTTILHHIGMHILHFQLPISSVLNLMDEHGNLKDENTIKVLNKQIEEFLKW
jgi:chromate reductase, NAD(P)H dehydrogenase (quinone)